MSPRITVAPATAVVPRSEGDAAGALSKSKYTRKLTSHAVSIATEPQQKSASRNDVCTLAESKASILKPARYVPLCARAHGPRKMIVAMP